MCNCFHCSTFRGIEYCTNPKGCGNICSSSLFFCDENNECSSIMQKPAIIGSIIAVIITIFMLFVFKMIFFKKINTFSQKLERQIIQTQYKQIPKTESNIQKMKDGQDVCGQKNQKRKFLSQ